MCCSNRFNTVKRLLEETGVCLFSEKPNDSDYTIGLAGGESPCPFINFFLYNHEKLRTLSFVMIDDRVVDEQSQDSNLGELKRKVGHHFPITSVQSIWENAEQTRPLDLLILGMGEDGHIASIFPNMKVSDYILRGCAYKTITSMGNPSFRRFSLTLDTLLAARKILLVMSSEKKYESLNKFLVDKQEGLPVVQMIKKHKNLKICKIY